MENTIISLPLAVNADGGLNVSVVAKNISAMYPDTLLLAQQELTAAVCRLYDLGMDYPDFIDSESLASFFGGMSYARISGDGKKYDFIDGEHANVEVLVDVFTDPRYIDEGSISSTKSIIINAVKASIIDYLKDQSFYDEFSGGINLILHEVIPAEIIPEIVNTNTEAGGEYKKDVSTSGDKSYTPVDPMSTISDSGYPVIDLISEYVAGSSGRGNDLFSNPNPGLKEKPITAKEFDSISNLTTPAVEKIKQSWSPSSKSQDTIKNRTEAEKLLKLQ